MNCRDAVLAERLRRQRLLNPMQTHAEYLALRFLPIHVFPLPF
ncbi:MAG: hypothetical protein WCJ56_07890 [bacterium]